MPEIRTRWFRWVLAVGLALASVLGAVISVQAVEFVEDGTIPEGVVIDDDVFIGGQTVVIDGTVNGDLFAFGANVMVNGTVNGSLFAGAQNITVEGQVMGSIYGGASALTVGPSAMISRNLFFGGFSLETEPGSRVGRDLLVGGYQALLSGEVGRDVRAGVAALELAGAVGGDVKAEVGDPGAGSQMFSFFGPPGAPPGVAPGLRVANDAEIGGELTYTSPVEQQRAIESSPAGGVVYQTPVPSGAGRPARDVSVAVNVGRWFLARLQELMTLLLLGGLAVWLLPDLFNQVVERARTQPLPAAGWGLVAVIVGYAGAALVALLILAIGILLGIITLGGLANTVFGVGFSSLSLIFTVFVLLVTYGSKLVVTSLGGKMILGGVAPEYADHRVWPLVLGIALYVLLRAIPILGWLIAVVVTLIGLGAMWLQFREQRATLGPGPAVA